MIISRHLVKVYLYTVKAELLTIKWELLVNEEIMKTKWFYHPRNTYKEKITMSIVIIIIPYCIRIQIDFLIFESDLQEQAFFWGKEPITNSRISKKNLIFRPTSQSRKN